MDSKKMQKENSEKKKGMKETLEPDVSAKDKKEAEDVSPKAEQKNDSPKKKDACQKNGKKKLNEIDALKNELGEQKDKYIRLVAEYENYRKRTQKEKSDSYSEAFSTAVTHFLPMMDSLDKAHEFEPEDEGIKALLKQLDDILKALGVTVIESDGKPFDPNFHNAIMHEEDEDSEECMVVQTFQKGYMLGDKVIRPAMVKVVN